MVGWSPTHPLDWVPPGTAACVLPSQLLLCTWPLVSATQVPRLNQRVCQCARGHTASRYQAKNRSQVCPTSEPPAVDGCADGPALGWWPPDGGVRGEPLAPKCSWLHLPQRPVGAGRRCRQEHCPPRGAWLASADCPHCLHGATPAPEHLQGGQAACPRPTAGYGSGPPFLKRSPRDFPQGRLLPASPSSTKAGEWAWTVAR